MPIPVLLLPYTITWVLLIIYFFYCIITIIRFIHKVKKVIPRKFPEIPNVKGRKYSHPKQWQLHHFISKATLVLAFIVFFFYLGIFIKVYIAPKMPFWGMGIITFVPISLVYSLKSLWDICLSMCGYETRRQKKVKAWLKQIIDPNFKPRTKGRELVPTIE